MNAGHFVIHTDQGNIKVQKNSKGMPFIDLDGVEGEVALEFIQTVRGNMDGFTRREINEARAAREAQGMMGHPTDRLPGDGTCKHDYKLPRYGIRRPKR